MNVKLDAKLFEREIRNLESELQKSNSANYSTSIRIIRGEFESLKKENGQLKLEKEKTSRYLPGSEDDKLNQIQFKLDEALKLREKLTEELNQEKAEHSSTQNQLKLEKKLQVIYYEKQLKNQRDELNKSNENSVFHLKRKIYFLNEEIKKFQNERIKYINNGIQKNRNISRLTTRITELKEENNSLKEINNKNKTNSDNNDTRE